MKNILGMILGGIGTVLSFASINACPWGWIDEPVATKKMIEK